MRPTKKLKTCIDMLDVKGRGVFATVYIRKGSVIERAPALALDVCTTELTPYVYTFTYEDEDGEDGDEDVITEYWVGLGHTSLYNHDPNGNAEFDLIDDDEFGPLVQIVATRDIRCGEEITFDYTGEGLPFSELS